MYKIKANDKFSNYIKAENQEKQGEFLIIEGGAGIIISGDLKQTYRFYTNEYDIYKDEKLILKTENREIVVVEQ